MRKLAALAAVSLVAMVGCKSSDDTKSTDAPSATTAANTGSTTASSGSTGTTEFVSTDNRAPGVTADSIKIGISYNFFSDDVKKQLHTWHGDYEAMYKALIDDVNANGGVNGRKLDAVYVPIQLGVDGADDAACTQLTVDNKVFVAINASGGDAVLCYIDTHETATVGGQQTPERRAAAKAPWFAAEAGGDAEGDAVTAFVDNGDLQGTVAVLGTQDDQKNYDSTFKATLTAGGVNVVDTAFIDTSSGDTNVVNPLVDAVIQRFSSEGVDQLLIIGGGVAANYLPRAALAGFQPALRVSFLGSVGSYGGDAAADHSVLAGAKGYGNFDPADSYLEMTDEPTKHCVDVAKAAGIQLVERKDWTFDSGIGKTYVGLAVACKNVELLVALLEKAGPNLDYGTLQHAGDTLGDIYLFGDTKPFHYGPGNSADGDQAMYPFVWDDSQNAMIIQQ
jgi:hypothetical protein